MWATHSGERGDARVEASGGTIGNSGGGLQASLGGRYALALFELAAQDRKVEAVEQSLGTVRDALDQSADLRQLTASPLIGRGEAGRAALAVADDLRLDPLTKNFMGVLAENRRLAALPDIIRAYRQLAARHRGEATASVTSAHSLDDEQVRELKQQLRLRLGREVAVDLTVDPDLLGGLVVRIGSQMIDSSIRTRLNALGSAMKG